MKTDDVESPLHALLYCELIGAVRLDDGCMQLQFEGGKTLEVWLTLAERDDLEEERT